MAEFNFEKLIAWQKAKTLCVLVYKITNSLPEEEKYVFTSQIRRAVLSISSNLAEGSSRSSKKEKVRYINISFGSLNELISQIIISQEIFGYITKEEFQIFKASDIELSKILSGLKKSLE